MAAALTFTFRCIRPLLFLLASVLKPVDDPRMLGKFARTLATRPDVRVVVAGQAAKAAVEEQANLTVRPIFRGGRLGLDRLRAQWRYWRLLRTERPAVVVVHAPELLPLTLLWQAGGPGRRFYYDIQENFALNITTQRVYGRAVGQVLAKALRAVEGLAARRAAGLLLAEISYADELPCLRQVPAERVAVLENKYQPLPGEPPLPTAARALPSPNEPLRLLFSGTISVLNGVWEAIALARHLRATWPGGAQLTIMGLCQQPELLAQLTQTAATEAAWLTLVGGAAPVPYARIVAAIGSSHLGLVAYRAHPSSERCRPTKLFEYLAHGLPVLVPPNPLWTALVRQYTAGLVIAFAEPAPAAQVVAQALLAGPVFYPLGAPVEALWATEAKKLWRLLRIS